jgi:hypothetical protein
MGDHGTRVRCGGGGRWRDINGRVVATPGLIGPGISTRPCGWTQPDPAEEARTTCPWCGGKVGWAFEPGQPVRPVRVVKLP